jgi:Bacterial regulatory helix-turn-helix protein, lysR family/Protein of unknown function (DUF3717)
MNLSSRQLRAFVGIVQYGNFTRAAERLGITQAGLSAMIREMEGQLQCRLFNWQQAPFINDQGFFPSRIGAVRRCVRLIGPMEMLLINQLELAINRARAKLPASGHEAALSHDVSVLASLYGELIYRQEIEFDLEQLGDEQQMVLLRWL